jgi:hypothetical protein
VTPIITGGMAFEIPAHLSRRAQTKEHSTIILEEIGESSWDTLTVAQSKQWLEELDAAIAGTTVRYTPPRWTIDFSLSQLIGRDC